MPVGHMIQPMMPWGQTNTAWDSWHGTRRAQRKRVDSARRHRANRTRGIDQLLELSMVMLLVENVGRLECLWAIGTECGPICIECGSEVWPIGTECEPNRGDICGSEG